MENKKKKIIFDCDNTFGVTDCDVDDGLALLYLLGCADVEVCGITGTYGNNNIDVVMSTIHAMLKDLGREDITVKRGGASCGEYESEAARYLAQMADKYKGEISILATGSLTNLMGAYMIDPHFFENVKEIVLMGGITQPLVFKKEVMNELNFSCDPKATEMVLRKGNYVSVITGNNCLKVLFTKEEYKNRLMDSDTEIARYILEKTDYYFQYNEEGYGIEGFYNWDVTAAVYLMHPEFFEDGLVKLQVSEEDLHTGYLRQEEPANCVVNLPKIGADKAFRNNIYNTWMNVVFE